MLTSFKRLPVKFLRSSTAGVVNYSRKFFSTGFAQESILWDQQMKDVTFCSTKDVETFYDSFSNFYDRKMTDWSWAKPSIAQELMLKYGENDEITKNNLLLDCGCGTGMTSQKLYEIGYQNIIGVDISNESIKKAKEKNIFKELYSINLDEENNPKILHLFSDNMFNNLVCMGVLLYINNKEQLFNEWHRVLMNNSLIIFSIREDVLKDDIKVINAMENSKKWKRVELIDPIPHIPGSTVYGNELKSNFYVARNVK